MRRTFGVVVLVAGVVASAGAADEAVKYKKYAPKVGDKVRNTKDETAVNKTVVDMGGKTQEKVEKKAKRVVSVTETLEAAADAARPTKARRVYETAEETVGDKTTKTPLDGKTVLIEKKGGKYAFTFADGEAVDAKAAADLEAEFNKNKDAEDELFPDKPLKPGDTWDIKGKVAELLAGPDVPFVPVKDKVTGTGKLVKTYQKDGKRFGVIDLKGEIPIAEIRGAPLKVKPGSTMTLGITGDGCFDGTSPNGTSTTTVKILVDGEVMGVSLKVTADLVTKSRSEAVEK